MKIYALNVRNAELNERFYKTLIDIGFNLKGRLGHRKPLTDDCSSEVYWLFFDSYKTYLSFFDESDTTDGRYSSDLEGASKYIQDCIDNEEALVEEFNWREADAHCIDLGQLM